MCCILNFILLVRAARRARYPLHLYIMYVFICHVQSLHSLDSHTHTHTYTRAHAQEIYQVENNYIYLLYIYIYIWFVHIHTNNTTIEILEQMKRIYPHDQAMQWPSHPRPALSLNYTNTPIYAYVFSKIKPYVKDYASTYIQLIHIYIWYMHANIYTYMYVNIYIFMVYYDIR